MIDDEDNDDYAIEVRSRFPPNVTAFDGEYPVAGVSKYQEALTHFIEGSDRRLVLEPEPTNQYDRNAIRVDAIWREADGEQFRGPIGYVPREHAAVLARRDPNLILHARPIVLFRPTKNRHAGIRIEMGWSVDEDAIRRQAARRTSRRQPAKSGKGCASVLIVGFFVLALAATAFAALVIG